MPKFWKKKHIDTTPPTKPDISTVTLTAFLRVSSFKTLPSISYLLYPWRYLHACQYTENAAVLTDLQWINARSIRQKAVQRQVKSGFLNQMIVRLNLEQTYPCQHIDWVVAGGVLSKMMRLQHM